MLSSDMARKMPGLLKRAIMNNNNPGDMVLGDWDLSLRGELKWPSQSMVTMEHVDSNRKYDTFLHYCLLYNFLPV